MTLTDFVANFAAQLEETDPATITADTKFRELEEWSSLTALSIMAMADDEYGMKISGMEVRKSETVKDLFDIIAAKK